MDKNLQNIDDVFNSAYNSFEEEPSDSTWEKLNAALDKEDAEKYKRRFIGWKRIAALLFFLLASFMIYETGIIVNRKKDSGITNRESLSDSTLVKDKIDYHKKKTAAEYVSISPETKKSRLKGDSTIAFQSLKVLQETNQNKKTAPVVKLQPNSPINQPETVTVVSKHGNKNRKPERGITKFSVKSGVTGQGETQLFAANNSINDQVNRDREMIKDKQLVKNTDKEKDSIRRPGILPLISTPRDEMAKSSVTGIAIKIPALPVIKLNPNSNQQKIKKATAAYKPSWWATAFLSNDWGQYQLDNDVEDNTGNQPNEKEEISRREKHEASYSAGVMVMRQFHKHFGFKTGVVYSNTAIVISPQEMYAAKKLDGSVAYKYITSSGYGFIKPDFGLPPSIGDSLQSSEAQHNLQMISVPLLLSYRFEKKKLSVSPAVGLSANFITSAKVKTEVKDVLDKEAVTINGLDGMRNFYTGFMADINVQYNVNSRWAFSLLPVFKYAITPITKSNVVKTFPYSFNIGAGVSYKF